MPNVTQVCLSALAIGFIGTAAYLFFKRRAENDDENNQTCENEVKKKM